MGMFSTKTVLPKILIVDDKSENIIAMETLLAKVDAQVIRASSGNEAIALTLDHDFALVLLDVQMPDMDGFEVAELLHNSSKTEHLPIIFVSAIYYGDVFKVKGVDSGAVDFIEKPINPALLLGKVRLFLELYLHRQKLVEDSFLSVASKVSDGVMIVSHARNILLVNPAAVEHFGIEAEDLIGTPFDYPLQTGILQELSYTRRDGQKRHVELNVSEMDWQGDAVFVVSMRDVTGRFLSKDMLETVITELNAKNTELESFNYTVSHDLRSPLITISGLTELLSKTLGEDLPAETQLFMDGICTATNKMGLLLDHLLTLSRIGRSDNFLTNVSMNTVVTNATEILSAQLAQKKVSLLIEDDLPYVMGDIVSLTQMLQNLIDNAINYMGKQQHPTIEIGSVLTSDGKVMFIRDNGEGIAPEYLDNIFGLFKRLSAETEGSGVGLAIVKKVASFHNGAVWVESLGEGKGSTFWIQLPFT